MTKNNKTENASTWKLSVISPITLVSELEDLLLEFDYENSPTLSDFEIEGDFENRLLEAYFTRKPQKTDLIEAIKKITKLYDISPLQVTIEKVEDKNWVIESQKLLKPVDAGIFYVFGEHDKDSIPDNKIPIMIEAGQAFGTGNHETTKGCLLALTEIDLDEKIDVSLDLGTGSGVLAIAVAKKWNKKVVATDIDPIATQTALENFILNNTGDILTITCDGFEDGLISKEGPYNLIVANILAQPLQIMAGDIMANLKKGGYLVLSGLLNKQEKDVLKAYKKPNMEFVNKHNINNWSILILKKKN